MGHLIEEKHSPDVSRAWLLNKLDDLHRETRAARSQHESNVRRRAQWTAGTPFATSPEADTAAAELAHARRMVDALTKFESEVSHVLDAEFLTRLRAELLQWRDTLHTLTERAERADKTPGGR